MIHPRTRGRFLIGSTRGKLFLLLIFLSLATLVVFQLANTLGAAHAGQGTRQLFDTLGDKDDLPVAPTPPVSCTRASTGKGVIQGTITDVNTGQPIAHAYIGISPGAVNSFACYTHTNADGSFAFTKLNPGTYNLSASRWTVNGTDPLYRDSVIWQIPVGSGKVTVNVSLTPLQSPGYRKIGSNDATNLIIVDMDETYFNSWFTDYNSVANPKVTPVIHNFVKQGVNATEEWTQYGYSPIDHYQLAVGSYPTWRTPDGPAKYWTQPDPNLDVNLWYSGGPKTAEEFGQESIFDVAKSYGMNTAVIGGNDYPSGHITDANIDEINLNSTNPCSTPSGEVKKMENFITSSLSNPNGFVLYAPLTQAEGFNTENTSPDAPAQVFSCSSANGWSYAQASIWDDQAFGQLLDFLKHTKQGSSTLFNNTAIIVTGDEAENDITNFDNFYPTGPGEPGLGTTRHTPWIIEGPNIRQNKVYKAQMRIDDTSVNAMATLGLPAPYDSRGNLIPQFFINQPQVLLSPVQLRQSQAFVPGNGGAGGTFDSQFLSASETNLFLAGKPDQLQSQGFISLLENNVGGYTTTISAQNESTSSAKSGSIVVYDKNGNVVVTKKLKVPLMPNSDWVINAAKLGLPNGFAGTALLQADQPLAVVSNETSSNEPVQSIEGYAASETGSSLYAPLVLNNVHGVTSYLSISNLSPCSQCSTTVTVTFYNAKGKPLAHTSSQIAPFGQVRVDASKVSLPNDSTVDAIITSNPPQALAATVYTQNGKVRSFTYNALSSGDTSLNVPLVENGVNGQSTSLTLEGASTLTDHVTIAYLDTSGNTVATQKVVVVARGSATETAAGAGLPAGFTGSASIISDHKVAVTSQVSDGKSVSAFNAVRTLDYTLYTAVYEPQVQNAVGGVTSSVTVTNTGTQSTTEQIQYFNYNGNAVGKTPTATLAPGASYTFNQGDPASGLATGFIGSAVVTSSAFQHSSVVVTYSGGNEVRSYDGSQAQTGQLVLTIGQLRQNFSSFNGLVVTVVGAIVTRSFGSNWFIQDSTGGIRMYVGGGAGQQGGDIETVTGVLTTYAGELEIDPASASDVIKTGTGKIPTPVVVTTQQIAQLKYNSSIDGELVTIPVSTITSYNPPSLGLTDSSGVQCNAFFDSNAQKNIDLSKFHQGEQVVTTGVLQLFGNNYKTSTGEIDPLLTSDFVMYG